MRIESSLFSTALFCAIIIGCGEPMAAAQTTSSPPGAATPLVAPSSDDARLIAQVLSLRIIERLDLTPQQAADIRTNG
ncbi:MAG TPA: hypothetical protein VFJ58_23430 [Armatimonadota bacterium]|nr:hypothetical protein [Armatimonadota bacterium]